MGKGLGIFIVLMSILVTSVFASVQLSQITNIARIADFNNDGMRDILAFSDRIDSRNSEIKLFRQLPGNTFDTAINLGNKSLKRCSLSYNDYTNNSFLDIFFTCFDDTQLYSRLLTYDGINYTKSDLGGLSNSSEFSANAYGDTLFLDFNNDGFADILSCFHGDTNLTLFLSNGTHFTPTDSGIPRTIFFKNNQFHNCFLAPLDVNGNGMIDIIAYQYDANNFSLFQNQFCNATHCHTPHISFKQITDNAAFNQTYFENKKIKQLRAFDANENGFSDLFYIADVSTSQSGPRNITFGSFMNNAFNISYTSNLTLPVIDSIVYRHVSPQFFRLSWENYTQERDFYEIRINNSVLQLYADDLTLLRTDENAATYNIIFNNSNITIGDLFVSSYDHHAGFGNLLKRTHINLSIAPQCFDVSVQAIRPSGLVVQGEVIQLPLKITVGENTFPIEICDGFDNSCENGADGPFTFFWPDGNSSSINFTQQNGLMVNEKPVFRNPNNRSQYVEFDCSWWQRNTGKNFFTSRDIVGGSGDRASGVFVGNQQTVIVPDVREPEGSLVHDDPDPQPQQPSGQGGASSQIEHFSLITMEFERFFTVEHLGDRTRVTEQIKNIERTRKDNIRVRKEFPTSILPHASQLQTTSRIIIISPNPIIDFLINDLEYLQTYTMTYTLPGFVSEQQIRQIPTTITATNQKTQEEIQQIELAFMQTASETLQTQIRERVEDNRTIIELDVNLQEGFSAVGKVEIEQFIPKCLIEEITETALRAAIDPRFLDNVQIKEADPLLVWTFDQFDQSQQLMLTLDALRDEDCDDEILIRTLAQTFIRDQYEINRERLTQALLLTAGILLFFALFFALTQLKSTKAKLSERSLEIFIFVILLTLSLLELIGALPGYQDYIKKLISIFLLLLILYKAQISKILFNQHLPKIDFLILGSLLLMSMNNFVLFATRSLLEADVNFIFDLYQWMWNNQIFLQRELFFIGLLTLGVISFYIALKVPMKQGSFFALFTHHEHVYSYKKIIRAIKIWIIFTLFYFVIFTRIIEWLAVTIDSAVIVLSFIVLFIMLFTNEIQGKKVWHHFMDSMSTSIILFLFILFISVAFFRPFVPYADFVFYIILIILGVVIFLSILLNIKQRMTGVKHATTLIDSLYIKFVKLFKHPQTLFLGISGLFILQQIVEIVLFIIPNITGKASHIYGTQFDVSVVSLFTDSSLVSQHLLGLPLNEQIILGLLYFISLVGMFMLFFIPVYLWILYFAHRKIHPSRFDVKQDLFTQHKWLENIGRVILVFGLPSLVLSLYTKLFTIQPIQTGTEVGIQIFAQRITYEPFALLVWGIAVLGFLLFQKRVVFLTFATSLALAIYFYVFPYAYSIVSYSIELIQSQSPTQIFFGTFLLIDAFIIYILGLLAMVFYLLSPPVKQKLVSLLRHTRLFNHFFFLEMMRIDYYEDCKAQNIVHHLEHFIRTEIHHGHHIESFMMQLKLHHYPDLMIQEAVELVLKEHTTVRDVEHIHAAHIDIEKIKYVSKLLLKKGQHKWDFLRVFEEYEDSYSYLTIKLAYRYASKNMIDQISLHKITQDEHNAIHALLDWVHSAEHKLSIPQMEKVLIEKGWDPELVVKVIEATQVTPELREEVHQAIQKNTPIDAVYDIFMHHDSHKIYTVLPTDHPLRKTISFVIAAHKHGVSKQVVSQQLAHAHYDKSFIHVLVDNVYDGVETLVEREYEVVKE